MRAWVIANGPSLRETPLEKLRGEFCIGINRVHLIYPHTSWRPSAYVKTDHNPSLTDVWARETLAQVESGIPCWLWVAFRDGLPEHHPNHETLPYGIGDHGNVTWVKRCEHHQYHHNSRDDRRAQEWHLPEICTAYSGISPALQVAVMLGATEVYILGADLGYGRKKGHDHFNSSYDMGTRPLTDWDTQEVLEAHRMAKRSTPVPIFNATLGGFLEVYPRADMLEVLDAS